MIAAGPSPTASATTGTATRNAASNAVLGPKTRRTSVLGLGVGLLLDLGRIVRDRRCGGGRRLRRRDGWLGNCGRAAERGGGRLWPRLLRGPVGSVDDRLRNLPDRVFAEPGG